MNVAVIGKDQDSRLILQHLEKEGLTAVAFKVEDIDGFEGDTGDFILTCGNRRYDAGYVIVTGNIEYGTGLPGDMPSLKLTGKDCFMNAYKGGETVLVLLDYPDESTSEMTKIALKGSVWLAGKKRKVTYLSRFIKTAEPGMEDLYKRARNLGVTFIKYDSISVDYNYEGNIFKVCVNDGYQNIAIETQCMISSGKRLPGTAELKAAEILGLKLGSSGFIDSERFFLYPALTNRKGIYSLTCNDPEDTSRILRYIISDIKSSESKKERVNLHAQVDAEKCAFCYTCLRTCPHVAMVPDKKNSVMKNLSGSCYGCGICVTVCPAHAIEMVPAMGRGLTSKPGRLRIFCCENSAEIALKKVSEKYGGSYEDIDVSPLSCGGEASIEKIMMSLETCGRVLVAACVDDACRHFEGNLRAMRQVERARRMLKSAGLDENKVEYIGVSPVMHGVMEEYVRIEDIP